MGIPLYYKHIISQHPDIITESKNKIIVNNLLFDLNCAIHPCCAQKTDEKEMFSLCEIFILAGKSSGDKPIMLYSPNSVLMFIL